MDVVAREGKIRTGQCAGGAVRPPVAEVGIHEAVTHPAHVPQRCLRIIMRRNIHGRGTEGGAGRYPITIVFPFKVGEDGVFRG